MKQIAVGEVGFVLKAEILAEAFAIAPLRVEALLQSYTKTPWPFVELPFPP
jgi:hypothetical protein